MGIRERIAHARDLTPTEQQLAMAVLGLGERIRGYSVKELARATATSAASINRFCKKLGFSGLKELKVAMLREPEAAPEAAFSVDVNFPFAPGDTNQAIMANMSSLYAATVADTTAMLDLDQLSRATRFITRAESIEIYTGSHNVYPAQMFEERLLSAGKRATCPPNGERQIRLALASNEQHAALIITYSGLAQMYRRIISELRRRKTPIILVGSPRARRNLPGLDAYLMVSERESLQNRITQFASHIAVQFVLDTLFCCVFAQDYAHNMAFLQQSLPYTVLEAGRTGMR